VRASGRDVENGTGCKAVGVSHVLPATAEPNPLRLEPEPAAARHARSWVTGILAGWPVEGVETARLLVSELVTNSVLHAGTPIAVAYRPEGARARFEVRDGHAAAPVPKRYAADSPTGRGLRLLASLAEDWGVERGPDGKTVWFAVSPAIDAARHELVPVPASRSMARGDLVAAGSRPGGRGTGASGGTGEARGVTAGRPGVGEVVDVQVLALPPDVYHEAEQHNDAVVRELALIVQSANSAGGLEVPRRLLDLATEVRRAFAPASDAMRVQVEEAIRRGDATVDIHMSVPRRGWEALLRLADWLDEVDRYCREGELLTLESSPRLRRFRAWYAWQVADQMQGSAPTPWEPTA